MCDPVSAAVTIGAGAIGGAVYAGEKARRDANQAAREQEAAAASLLSQAKPASAGMSLPSVPEPLKQASENMDGARADMASQQQLRRGLMSTFTRYARARPPQSASSTANKATKLGG